MVNETMTEGREIPGFDSIGMSVALTRGGFTRLAVRSVGGPHGADAFQPRNDTKGRRGMSAKNDREKSKNSGQGALGMGGQPDDDPRGLESGRERLREDDLGGGTGPVGGAFGSPGDTFTGGGSAGDETVGPTGDKGITGDITAAAEAARKRSERESPSDPS